MTTSQTWPTTPTESPGRRTENGGTVTYTRMVELLASKTGYPKKIVQHILDAQGDLIKNCMVNQEEVHFPMVLKIWSERRRFSWKGTVGEGEGERIVLHVKPMKTLRKDLNRLLPARKE